MDDYLKSTLAGNLRGVSAAAWLEFFKIFTDTATDQSVRERIQRLRRKFESKTGQSDPARREAFEAILGIIETTCA